MFFENQGKFLTELHKLYEANKELGSVWVTMKRSELGSSAVQQQWQSLMACSDRHKKTRRLISPRVIGFAAGLLL